MVFFPPAYLPALPELPDDVPLEEFMRNEKYGRRSISESQIPYVCGVTGQSYTAADVNQRTDYLARAIGQALSFDPQDGTEWDRVVALFSFNTIDYIPFTHSIHRLNGIVTPASAAYSPSELEHQLRTSGAKAMFTCAPLLDTALKAAKAVGIPKSSIFIVSMPNVKDPAGFTTIDRLVIQGSRLPALPPLKWTKGQAKRQVAYLCFSSGTSGLPKAVMISHLNMIANIVQSDLLDSVARKKNGIKTQTGLGLLPFSHIYGLTLVAHVSQYRGDSLIVLPKFDLKSFLEVTQKYKIEHMNIVPPILIQILSNMETCKKYDLSSVRALTSGAAPLGIEVVEDLHKVFPNWSISQAYGMTESSPVVMNSSETDVLRGSSGSLVPGTKAKIIDLDGNELTGHEQRGELLVQSPSIVLGYLNNEKANAKTFVWHHDGRWLKTGDEVLCRKAPSGNEHFFIVDRIKELIKVKGHQVAPAELEAHLLAHPFVSDTTVIPVPDGRAGEVPKAFVVKSPEASGKPDEEVVTAIRKHVEEHKARHKWLNGGVEFIDVIPKSASGKILRRLLRDMEKQKRAQKGAKL